MAATKSESKFLRSCYFQALRLFCSFQWTGGSGRVEVPKLGHASWEVQSSVSELFCAFRVETINQMY